MWPPSLSPAAFERGHDPEVAQLGLGAMRITRRRSICHRAWPGVEPSYRGRTLNRRLILHLLLSSLLGIAALLTITSEPVQAAFPPPGGALPSSRVTMISDSVGAALLWHPEARVYLAEGFDFRLEALACRRLAVPGCPVDGMNPPSALETVRTLGDELGRVVIMVVGYNDPPDAYASGFDSVMQALLAAHVERVIWVTLNEHEDVWVENNTIIRTAKERWPALVVADWAPLATEHPEWFNDVAHLNAAGAMGLAHLLRPLIVDSLSATRCLLGAVHPTGPFRHDCDS